MNKQYLSRLALTLPEYSFSLIAIFCAVCLLASCAPTRNASYFKTLTKDTTIGNLVNAEMESKIVKGDNLAIIISSLSSEEDVVFNTGSLAGGALNARGFPVDNDGFVVVHKLGRVKAEGFTRKEFAEDLQKKLLPYLKDPIVTIQYLNHKITIFGEVGKPQVLYMPEEQLSLIDVLVLSGDLTERGKKDDIMIIREDGNQRKVKHLNLEDHSIFTSPWYFVQPNDIVVVNPDFEKADRETRRIRFQTNFSIFISTVSFVLIIVDRIFR